MPSTTPRLRDDRGAALTVRDRPPRRGGEASVYQAEDAWGRAVAVKVAHVPGAAWVAEERAILCSLREAPATRALVAAVLGGGTWGHRPFLVLEWYPDTLVGWLETQPPLDRRLEMAARLADTVARLHDARPGLVHRDLKPSNVLLNGERLVVADFGGARLHVPGHTLTRRAVHTPGYAAPELSLPGPQAPSQDVDVYALAATVFHVLVGRPPAAPGRNARCLTPDGQRLVLGLLTREDAGWARWLEPARMVALGARDQDDLAAAIGRGEAWTALLDALEPDPGRRPMRARIVAARLADTSAIAAARASLQRRRWYGGPALALVLAAGLVITAAFVGGAARDVAAEPASIGYPMVRFAPAAFTDPVTGALTRIERPFELGVYEVTQATWRAVTGEDPTIYRQTSGARQGYYCNEDYREVRAVGDDLPAACISWFDAVAFANHMSLREGLTPAYRIVRPAGTDTPEASWLADADGYRLPSIAEWTHAALRDAGPDGPFATATPCRLGNLADTRSAASDHLPCDDGFGLLAPVGRFPPTPAGVHDLVGNVAEWLWEPTAEGARYLAGPNFGASLRPPLEDHYRGAVMPSERGFGMGVRLARTAR